MCSTYCDSMSTMVQDVIITFVLATVLALVGILAAYMAYQWAQLNDDEVVRTDPAFASSVLPRARDVLAATAVSIIIMP